MEDFIKKYWPFLAAIAILLYLLDVCESDKAAAAKTKATVPAGSSGTTTGNTTTTTVPPVRQPGDCWTETNPETGATYMACI